MLRNRVLGAFAAATLFGLMPPLIADASAAVTRVRKPAPKKVAPKPEPVAAIPVSTRKPGTMSTPSATLMRNMTPVETEANAVWNLRAGLNLAALQCQYSKYLGTVLNYNDLLKHHSAELVGAQTTMMAHFKRYDGKRAISSFDEYTTATYNSFSTLDAQYAFCEASSLVGRGALMVAKGQLGKYAMLQTPVLRASLIPVERDPDMLLRVPLAALPPIEP